MIYWITLGLMVLLAAIGIFIWNYGNRTGGKNKGFKYWIHMNLYQEWPGVALWVITVILFVLHFIMTCCVLDAHIGNEGYKQEYMAQYNVLSYAVEHMDEDDINELYKMETYSQIKEYNAEVARYKAQLENPWIDIFISPCFEDVPLIELE